MHDGKQGWMTLGLIAILTATCGPGRGLDKPTGAPLVLSDVETEQSVPLAILAPDHKTASCVTIRLHWNPQANVGPSDDATNFTLDLAATDPSASIFTAQLWSASLASAVAWQQPWQGARWKVLQVPATDGSGIDAALAVGMVATSARRPYPKETAVIASLNPDGSLGPVSRLSERMSAAAANGVTRVIIASVQRFDLDATGQVINSVRHASDLHIECLPVDNLVDAIQTVMNDPLPELTLDASTPKYSNDVASYIDNFAHREQSELNSGLQFAPKEVEIDKYPPRLAAIWKTIYADNDSAQQSYRAGQVYVAYQLFARTNARLHGLNALAGQNRITFDVKTALADSDGLRKRLHDLMNPPDIDKGDLQSAVLVSEMADWAYDVNATLEGAQLVTKQTFSQRTDATDAEKDRARETMIFALEQAKYLINASAFYNGLLPHLGDDNPVKVDENAAHLLPQLIPAQLATARLFTEGIRQEANDLRNGLLFDPRLVAYVDVLRETKADWDARQRKKELEAQAAAAAPAATAANPSTGGPVKLNDGNTTMVAFDPGNTYAPPHTALAPTVAEKKLSDAALCLIWANTDCEIATLDEKYLRLNGTVDPTTHEWHVQDRAKLDSLLQAAELGARRGITFAGKAEIDVSVLAMIYEKAGHLRIQGDDASALDALRQYWRCALLGNLCWQLAHAQKAQAVDLTNTASDDNKPAGGDDKKGDDKGKVADQDKAKTDEKPVATNDNSDKEKENKDQKPEVASTDKSESTKDRPSTETPTPKPSAPEVKPDNVAANPSPPPHQPDAPASPPPTPPVAVAVTPPPHAPVVADATATPTPAPATTPAPPNPPTAPPAPPTVVNNDDNIPVAPIAKPSDMDGGDSPTTNAAPVIGPTPPPPKTDNSDGHSAAFP
jgi:hypothetical protein